jgi:hypothetical protein
MDKDFQRAVTTSVYDIVENLDNADVLREFFIGGASGDYYDGTCWSLYLDLTDNTLFIEQQNYNDASRCDFLVRLSFICGYTDQPQDELFHAGDDVNDYGWDEFIDQVERRVEVALTKQLLEYEGE